MYVCILYSQQKTRTFNTPQTWAHYECIGEGEGDIVGIWTCSACRKMPTMVMELIGMVAKLQESVSEMRYTNAQLVGMLSDRQSELHRLREDVNERLPVDTANTHAETTIDSSRQHYWSATAC